MFRLFSTAYVSHAAAQGRVGRFDGRGAHVVQLSEQQSVACVHAPDDAHAAAVQRLVLGSHTFEQHSPFIAQVVPPARQTGPPPSPADAERSAEPFESLCEQAPASSATAKNTVSGRMRFTSQHRAVKRPGGLLSHIDWR